MDKAKRIAKVTGKPFYTPEEIWDKGGGVVTMDHGKLRRLLAIALSRVPKRVVDRAFQQCRYLMLDPEEVKGMFIPKFLINALLYFDMTLGAPPPSRRNARRPAARWREVVRKARCLLAVRGAFCYNADGRQTSMRAAQSKEITELHIGKDGTLRIPAGLVRAAQLQAGDKVSVRVLPKQLALVGDTVTEANRSRRERMARAVRRVAEQDRRADAYLAQMPVLDEPAPEENFDYPLDPVIDTPKIRKLRKRT